nr:hypothetical protein [Streptomyces populi]
MRRETPCSPAGLPLHASRVFDPEGRHVRSDIWCAGTWAEQQRHPYGDDSPRARAEARPAELLEGLPRLGYGGIAVRPFRPAEAWNDCPVTERYVLDLACVREPEPVDDEDWA